MQFQEHPQAWTRVDFIIENSQNNNTKLIGLNILDKTVKFRWNVLPPQQREAVKSYIVGLIIKLSTDAETLKRHDSLVQKLNVVLIQVRYARLKGLCLYPPVQRFYLCAFVACVIWQGILKQFAILLLL